MKKFAFILSVLVLSVGILFGCTQNTGTEKPVNSGEEQSGESVDIPGNDTEENNAEESAVSYKDAYIEVIDMLENIYEDGRYLYDLIDVNGDEIPELVASYPTVVNLYTFDNGKAYPIMEDWVFGAGGNSGYAYLPGKNVIQNFDADMAGLIVYETYWKIGDGNEIELYYNLPLYKTLWKDTDGNGMLDEGEEEGEFYFYGNDEITKEEYDSYLFGDGFEYIEGTKSYDEIMAELQK